MGLGSILGEHQFGQEGIDSLFATLPIDEAQLLLDEYSEDVFSALSRNGLIDPPIFREDDRLCLTPPQTPFDGDNYCADVYDTAARVLGFFGGPNIVVPVLSNPWHQDADEAIHIVHRLQAASVDALTLDTFDLRANVVLWHEEDEEVIHGYVHQTYTDFVAGSIKKIIVSYMRMRYEGYEEDETLDTFFATAQSLQVPVEGATHARIKQGDFGPYPVFIPEQGIYFKNNLEEYDIVDAAREKPAAEMSESELARVDTLTQFIIGVIDDYNDEEHEESESDEIENIINNQQN